MADDMSRETPRIMLAWRSDRAYRVVKTGSSAGTAPTVASITKCPEASIASPPRSISVPSGRAAATAGAVLVIRVL